MSLLKIISVVLMFVVALAASSASASCADVTVHGMWGILYGGQDSPGEQATIVGQATFDSATGTVSGTLTKSKNGVIGSGPFTGTYAIAPNCTGTISITNGKKTENWNIVLDDSYRNSQLIRIDAGHVHDGFALAQSDNCGCGLTGGKQTFALNLTGEFNGTGPIAIVGRITLNGSGGLSGIETINVNGTISKGVAVTGTYTANTDCTGTAQITPTGFQTMNFNSVVVKGGTEQLLIETDINTTVSGTMQQQ
ncbi:MAG TPA: hypothetical protein VED66_14615 [Candidatus Sulfotelmatobacter sp.]|nr:hypothetical protein [Candidatus Sulfotelmatobacter sp.]